MEIRPGLVEDLPFIMATERLPGYDALIGRSDEAQHRTRMADPTFRYLVGVETGRPIGFALLRDWNGRSTLLQRFAVAEPDKGAGRHFLAMVADLVFTGTAAHRFHLGTFPDNKRARRAYEAVGFQAEGIARGSAFFGGAYRDELIMALLRPDWERLRAAQV